MHKAFQVIRPAAAFALLSLCWLTLVPLAWSQPGPPPHKAAGPEVPIREIYVPFEDLNVLLEGDVRRVFLDRAQYEELLAQAGQPDPELAAPHPVLVLAAQYAATIEEARASLAGVVEIEVLVDGLQAVPLDLAGVGLRSVRLDDRPAALGQNEQGQAVLFVEGRGLHRLNLDLVTPLETSAAQQSLTFRVPSPAAAQLRLTVPGNVEIKSGASVVSRTLDEQAGVTRFELLLPAETASLVMSLNNRLLSRQRVVVARSVLVDEVTAAYERLHATVSLGILHGAADRFRFALPEGFEPTEVLSPLMARWEVQQAEGRRELEVMLREPATDTVVLNISATRTPARLEGWTLPHLEPLDVAGQVAVVGLVVEQHLQAESMSHEGLIPLDNAVLTAALPETVFRVEPGSVQVRPVAAFYAPGPAYRLEAQFARPAARLQATTNLLLVVGDTGQRVRGGFTLLPEIEERFDLRFQSPPGWHVVQVTDADGTSLTTERYEQPDGSATIGVRLSKGVPPGETATVLFQAERVPPGWLGAWDEQQVEFPRFVLADADRDIGAIAVRAEDDLAVRPDQLEGLLPLDENEKQKYGLAGIESNLAYRYDGQPYRTTLTVSRETPSITARSYCFVRLAPGTMIAHYEAVFEIRQARTRRLSLLLPASTPASLAIRGLEGAVVKEFVSEETPAGRRWTILLDEPASGLVRLAIDFQQPLGQDELDAYRLPLPVIENVAYQSSIVAIEGHADLDLEAHTEARKVDVGELAAAQYRPGRRLLGVYEFTGLPGQLSIDIRRRDGYPLPPAIVQRAELLTVLSARGVSQNAARYELRTKAPFLEIQLPERARLWSAHVDGKPMAPQSDGDGLLISLPADAGQAVRNLQIVYETPVDRLGMAERLSTTAPRLLLRAERAGKPREVPVADMAWHLYLPTGHRLVRSFGSVTTDKLPPRRSPIWNVAAVLYELGGGMPGLLYGGLAAARVGGRHEFDRRMHAVDAATASPPAADSSAPLAMPEGMSAAGDELQTFADRESEEAKQESAARDDMPQQPAAETPQAEPEPSDKPARPGEADADQGGVAVGQRAGTDLAKLWALAGVRSLPIDLTRTGEQLTFRSLGGRPRLGVVVVNELQNDSLAWSAAALVLVVGIFLTGAGAGRKTAYVLIVALVALALPPLTGLSHELGQLCDAAFYAACLLVPYYLLVALIGWICRLTDRRLSSSGSAPGAPHVRPQATLPVALLACLLAVQAGGPAEAQERPAFDPQPLIELLVPPKPIELPADAVIIPYDSDAGLADLSNAQRVLVPYAKYGELWNRAFPDQRLQTTPPIVPYALAGAAYEANLAGDEHLELQGRLDVEVFSEDPVQIPLRIEGAVLAGALLDGKPARLQAIQPAAGKADARPAQQQVQQAAAVQQAAQAPPALIVLHAAGKGIKRLDLTLRIKLQRRGGWREASARIPAAPATSLALTVPAARTEVRLPGLADRSEYETEADAERIVTALAASGQLNLQWRPKVAEGQVDRSLTAESDAVFDVQEDALRLAWRVQLQFPRSRRDSFSFFIPPGYLVEDVSGENVRGWELPADQQRPRLNVTLLKEAVDSETLTLRLSQRDVVQPGAAAEIQVPVVAVDGANLHRGRLTLRRSPLIELRPGKIQGLTRTDIADSGLPSSTDAGEESPLRLLAFQAYQFDATPYAMQLTAVPIPDQSTAEVQMLLRIAERETTLESRFVIRPGRRPVHRVRIALPPGLEIERVEPANFSWAVADDPERRILSVYLDAGQTQPFSLVLTGSLGRRQAADPVQVPQFEILDVVRQQGDAVVQIDPAFNVRATETTGCQTVLLSRVFGWLQGEQRSLARMALHWDNPDYAATLAVSSRQPRVSAFTVTNVKITNIAVEETIVLDLTIRDAGIREVVFLLPASMLNPRIQAPMLRQKTIEPLDDGRRRVRLELQDEIIGQYRVLVENDRLLEMADARDSAVQQAPIPELQTGRTDQRYVTLEEAGRDEVEVVDLQNLQPLSRQQPEWRRLAAVLGEGITQAYLAGSEAVAPGLSYKTVQHATVQISGAEIGLAETFLIIDASGAYRARQTYRVNNTTEPFLELQLPATAELWTAAVAGEPVKPTAVPAPVGRVRIPLIKTAEGEEDYPVVVKYGGQLPRLNPLCRVEFPLIHTVNINVQLSHVRLRVPESFRWYHFGGTTRRVLDEGEFQADFFAYNAKQVKRLMQVWDSENPYARARVASNLKQLGIAVHSYKGQNERFMYNETFRSNFAANAEALERAQQETESYFQQAAQTPAEDNRGLLNSFFLNQSNALARNVVTDMKGNFQPTEPAAQPQQPQEQFRYDWLEKNQLDQRRKYSADDMAERVQQKSAEKPAGGKLDELLKGKAVLQDFDSPETRGRAQADANDAKPQSQRLLQTQQDLALQYQQQLESSSEMADAPASPAGTPGSGPLGESVNEYSLSNGRASGVAGPSAAGATGRFRMGGAAEAGQQLRGEGAPGMGGGMGGGGYGSEGFLDVTEVPPGQPTHLASLDVELPERGVEYLFTTPRGDVQIVGRAVSQSLVVRSVRLLGILVGLLALYVLYRIVQAVAPVILHTTVGAVLLIVIGLISIVAMILPVAGLAALAAGVVVAIRRILARTRASRTAAAAA